MNSSQTQTIPAPPGRFSRLYPITIGDSRLLFISGLAASVDTPKGVASQTERIFERIRLLLADVNAELKHIVKLTVILADMDDYAEYNAVRNRIFAETGMPPASTAFEGRLVAPEYRIEIEAIAIAPAN